MILKTRPSENEGWEQTVYFMGGCGRMVRRIRLCWLAGAARTEVLADGHRCCPSRHYFCQCSSLRLLTSSPTGGRSGRCWRGFGGDCKSTIGSAKARLERVARIRERWSGWRGLLPPGWQRRLCGWQDAGCYGLSWTRGRRQKRKRGSSGGCRMNPCGKVRAY